MHAFLIVLLYEDVLSFNILKKKVGREMIFQDLTSVCGQRMSKVKN